MDLKSGEIRLSEIQENPLKSFPSTVETSEQVSRVGIFLF